MQLSEATGLEITEIRLKISEKYISQEIQSDLLFILQNTYIYCKNWKKNSVLDSFVDLFRKKSDQFDI